MGRFLKNTQLVGGSYAVQLPLGTTTVGPSSPVEGQIRYNLTTTRIEYYAQGTWNTLPRAGNVTIVTDNFVGTGSQSSFLMSKPESDANSILVFVGGIYQQPNISYTVSSNTITFTAPPPAPVNPSSPITINVIHNLNSTASN
jgi:hypothetical protein